MSASELGTGPRALSALTGVTRTFLGVYLGLLALQAVSFTELMLHEFGAGYTMFLVVYPGAAASLLALTMIAAVPILLWIWHAHANLRADRLEGLVTTPAWAVLGLLLPGINLVAPHAAMRELWNRSHGEPDYFARQSVDLVNSWWTCFVAGALLETALGAQTAVNLLTNLKVIVPAGVNTFVHLLGVLLLGASAWFLLRIIGAIARAQQTVVNVGSAFE